MKKRGRCLPLLLVLAIAPMIFIGCGGPELHSKWRTEQISIDGFDTEWADSIVFYDEKSHMVIGMTNDADDMYIRISTLDRTMQKQLLHLGCTIWFDPEGGKKQTFGIHFPLGMQTTGMSMPVKRGEKSSPEKLQDLLQNSQEELQFVGSSIVGAITMVASEAEELGVKARIGMTKGFLVYELKLPLKSKESWMPSLISADSSKAVGIGFETGKMDRAAMPQAKGGGRGGRSGGRGGMGGKGGMRAGGNGEQRPQALELWTKVYLAGSPG